MEKFKIWIEIGTDPELCGGCRRAVKIKPGHWHCREFGWIDSDRGRPVQHRECRKRRLRQVGESVCKPERSADAEQEKVA